MEHSEGQSKVSGGRRLRCDEMQAGSRCGTQADKKDTEDEADLTALRYAI